MTVQIQNIVASVATDQKLDLDLLESKFRDVRRKKNFPALVIRLSRPKATILVFGSGSIIFTGIKRLDHLPILTEKVSRRFQEVGLLAEPLPMPTVQNIVASGDFHQTFRLDEVLFTLENTIYEPEVFPGLFYKMHDPKICVTLFSSGKIVITGASSRENLTRGIKLLTQRLKKNQLLGNA